MAAFLDALDAVGRPLDAVTMAFMIRRSFRLAPFKAAADSSFILEQFCRSPLCINPAPTTVNQTMLTMGPAQSVHNVKDARTQQVFNLVNSEIL